MIGRGKGQGRFVVGVVLVVLVVLVGPWREVIVIIARVGVADRGRRTVVMDLCIAHVPIIIMIIVEIRMVVMYIIVVVAGAGLGVD